MGSSPRSAAPPGAAALGAAALGAAALGAILSACATAPAAAAFPAGASPALRYELRLLSDPRPLRVHVAIADLGSGLLRLETPVVAPPRSSPKSEAALQDPVALAREAGSLLLVNASGFLVEGYRPGEHPLTYLPGMAVDIPGLAIHRGDLASPASPPAPSVWIEGGAGAAAVRLGAPASLEGLAEAACGQGPLVESGASVAREDSRLAARTAIGLDGEGRLLLVVVEGGDGDDSAGVTLRELATIMLGLGARSAVNMDGGGSSVMVLGTGGRQRAVSRGEERLLGIEIPRRPIPNAVAILPARP